MKIGFQNEGEVNKCLDKQPTMFRQMFREN